MLDRFYKLEIDTGEDLDINLESSPDIEFTEKENFQFGSGKKYKGETVITPTRETQVLETGGLYVPSNIIVNPIPKNYGLISWNGVTLTVS